MSGERRHRDRRQDGPTRFGERGMRCEGCGTVWYSAVASTVVRWGRCIQCGSAMHVERREGRERRHEHASAAA
jgi:hypothetical protein